MGLHQYSVDVVDVDRLVGTSDGFDQAADREVAGLAEHPLGGADDEVNGGGREGVVAVENLQQEQLDGGDGIEDAFTPLVAAVPVDLLDRFGGEPIADSGLDSLNGGGDT